MPVGKPASPTKKRSTASKRKPVAAPEKRSARRMRHRVMVAGKFVFGPGKADVLEAIGEKGSLAAAALSLRMSYMRAWRLVNEMKETFAEPVVELTRGGKTQGGAKLTTVGRQALALYRQMEAEALAATEPAWRTFCELLRSQDR